MNDTVQSRIRAFVDENFLFRTEGSELADGDSLLESGVMDSTGVLELVAFLESEFHLAMTDAEIVPENLDSIAAIVRYVEAKSATGIAA